MLSSFKTILPAIIICPGYHSAFRDDILNKHGIRDRFDYKKSDLYGNDSLVNERDLFNLITHNRDDIVKTMKVKLKSGKNISNIKFLEMR